MREILFRGKRTDNGKWVEGSFFPENDTYPTTIFERHCAGYFVLSETVGQYTGLKDKNGKRIFEGDIVTRILFDKLYRYEVVYQAGYASFDGIRKGGFISFGNDGDCFEVIGNIHDNPELMEVR